MYYYFKALFIALIVSIFTVRGNPINAVNDPRRNQLFLIDSTDHTLNSNMMNIEKTKSKYDNLKVMMVATGVIAIAAAVFIITIFISYDEMTFPDITDN